MGAAVSFDVFLQRFVDGESAEVDRRRVTEVLRAATHRGPDDFGLYIVAFSDGVEVEFSASGLESDEPFTGCAFYIHGFGGDLTKFMFDVARAGDLVLIPAMEGNPLILVSEEQKRNVPGDLVENLKPVVVRSAGELGAILTSGFNGWSAYRNQVLGQPAAEDEA
jgi:hypothetical protein